MAYTVTTLVAGLSTRQWQVTKGADADDTFSITHGLGLTSVFIPDVTPLSSSQATITAYKNAMPCVESITPTVINGRMSTAAGSATAVAIVTAAVPLA